MKKVFILSFALAGAFCVSSCKKESTVKKDRITFENLTPGPDGFYNGEDGAGGFTSGNAFFPTHYDALYESWSGFAFSNHTDNTTPGYENQYSSIAGEGADHSKIYALYYSWMKDTISFSLPEKITNISICNSAYAYYSMKDGDAFAKKFGGESGDDPDFFKLIIEGLDENKVTILSGQITLADFTPSDNAMDYISNIWTDIDLSEAGYIKYLVFSFDSSDKGPNGINTPQSVCIDNIFGELQE